MQDFCRNNTLFSFSGTIGAAVLKKEDFSENPEGLTLLSPRSDQAVRRAMTYLCSAKTISIGSITVL